MRRPNPEDFDHYPKRELAYNNAMNLYRRWKINIPLAIPDGYHVLSRVFDQSLGEDHCLAVEDEDGSRVAVFHNTMEKIKKKVTEFGGPHGFKILPLTDNVNSGCKAVVFDERSLDPCVVERCLRKLSGSLTLLDEGARIQSESDHADTWLLVV